MEAIQVKQFFRPKPIWTTKETIALFLDFKVFCQVFWNLQIDDFYYFFKKNLVSAQSNMVAISHICLIKFKLIKIK